MLKVVAFVPVRLTSTRLPEKHFKIIGDRPLLSWVIKRLKDCEEIDQIVVCAPDEPESKKLVDFCKRENVELYIHPGDVNDVVGRLTTAAKIYKADICVLASGDCPLLHSPSIDYLVNCLKCDSESDVIEPLQHKKGFHLCLEGIMVARIRAWMIANNLSTSKELREHQFPIIRIERWRFNVLNVDVPFNVYGIKHRLSVDTYADIQFMNCVYNILKSHGKDFELTNVMSLVLEKPDLLNLNKHVHQKKLYEKDDKFILFVVDAGDGVGYGHLMRCRELALQGIERKGWKVAFAVSNDASGILSEVGIRTIDSKTIWSGDGEIRIPEEVRGVIVDLHHNHLLRRDWRAKISYDTKVVVLNCEHNWQHEADLIFIPEVTYDRNLFPTNSRKVLYGIKYIILRREIRMMKKLCDAVNKDIDVLIYKLPFNSIELLNNHKVAITKVDKYTGSFHELLAKARIFISGFGYSFYEALFLNALPVTCPISHLHKVKASKFYEFFGLKELLIDLKAWQCDVSKFLDEYNVAPIDNLSSLIEDGTHRIVDKIDDIIE